MTRCLLLEYGIVLFVVLGYFSYERPDIRNTIYHIGS